MFESLSQDPRGPVGQMARGANVYMGASKSPYVGQMKQPSKLPQYKKMSLQEVAQAFLNGNRTQ